MDRGREDAKPELYRVQLIVERDESLTQEYETLKRKEKQLRLGFVTLQERRGNN